MANRRGQFTRKLILYRNGDPSFRPVHFLYNNSRIRNFNKLLEELDDKVPPIRGGAVRNLYAVDGGVKYETVDQVEGDTGDLVLVVGGPEGYRKLKGGYESIGKAKQQKALEPEKAEDEPPTSARSPRRPADQRVYNRTDPKSEVRKFTIVRSGDSSFAPKNYILRMRYIKNVQQLAEDIERLAPPLDGGVARLYTLKGELVEDIKDVQSGMTYVIAGENGFVEPRGGFPGHGAVAGGAGGGNGGLRRTRSSDSINRQATPLGSARGTPRSRGSSPRPSSERLYNRVDQIKPTGIIIDVFKNGEGLKSKKMIFSQAQIRRGWPWFLEQCAKPFGVDPKVLRTMDGREVNHTDQLIWKGAYVLVPKGERFRDDSWYYLGDGSVDTSEEKGDDGDQGLYDDQGNARPQTRARPHDHADRPEDDRTESARNSAGSDRYNYDNEYYSDDDGRGRETRASTRHGGRDVDYYDNDYDDNGSVLSEESDYYEDDRDGYGTESLNESDEDWAASRERHHHRHHHQHGRRGSSRPGTAMSDCSYCDMLESHISKHHSHNSRHKPHQRRRNHSAGSQRRQRVKENVRSISPSPNRAAANKNHGGGGYAGTGRKSIVSRNSQRSDPGGRGSNRLAASHPNPQRKRRSRSRSNSSAGRSPRKNNLGRTNSDAGLFYAKHNRQRKGREDSTYRLRRDESSPFGARKKRDESANARQVRDRDSSIPRSKALGDPKLRRERSKVSNLNF